MSLKTAISKFFKKYFFSPKWRCLSCGKEIFEGEPFCEECLKSLPFNDGYICAHCGRKTLYSESYCSTCKGKLVDIDVGRSAFNYEKPISNLIMRFKYHNARYLQDYFSDRLYLLYANNYFNADCLVYVPMTKSAKRKREYNQSEILARRLSEKVNVPVSDCLQKVKETKRQATLNRAERLKNLVQAFRVIDKNAVKGKTVVIVDDVTTTGATAQAVAERLKKAGAIKVYLLTVASTPPIDKY